MAWSEYSACVKVPQAEVPGPGPSDWAWRLGRAADRGPWTCAMRLGLTSGPYCSIWSLSSRPCFSLTRNSDHLIHTTTDPRTTVTYTRQRIPHDWHPKQSDSVGLSSPAARFLRTGIVSRQMPSDWLRRPADSVRCRQTVFAGSQIPSNWHRRPSDDSPQLYTSAPHPSSSPQLLTSAPHPSSSPQLLTSAPHLSSSPELRSSALPPQLPTPPP